MDGWRRLFGFAGLAFVLVEVVGVGFEFAAGQPPSLSDSSAFASYVAGNQTQFEAMAWLFGLAATIFPIFVLGLRRLIDLAGPEWRWVGSLVFGMGIVWAAAYLVSAAMAGVFVIDTTIKAEPAVVRAMFEGNGVLFGTVGMFPLSVLMAATGYATLKTGVLPVWSAWVGFAAAALTLVTTFSIFGGGDPNQFFTATGGAGGTLGGGAYLPWTLVISIVLIRSPAGAGISVPSQR